MLTELQKHTLQQIAEKKGEFTYILDTYWAIVHNVGEEPANTWLLWYLLNKSTIVAIFGGTESDMVFTTSERGLYSHIVRKSLEAALDYYEKYLGEANEHI